MIVDKIKQRQKIKLKMYNANVENITNYKKRESQGSKIELIIIDNLYKLNSGRK